MLKTRILTALVLLAVLLPVLFFNNFIAFAVVATAFFGAAAWEAARLFGLGAPRLFGVACCVLFGAGLLLVVPPGLIGLLFALSVLLWLIRFTPSLAIGLPALLSPANWALSLSFTVALFGCFYAIVRLFQHSPGYLLSVMALVWIADIGAYFSGKAFGKRKLAPSISPGKSWEGAIGGWIAVLALAAISTRFPFLRDTFSAKLQFAWRWFRFVPVMAVIVAASVVGDLFESQLKRRIAMKD